MECETGAKRDNFAPNLLRENNPFYTTVFRWGNSDVLSANGHLELLTTNSITVNPTKKYKLSYDILAGNLDGSEYDPDVKSFVGFLDYDEDGKPIHRRNVEPYRVGAKTELTRDLEIGDEYLYVRDGSDFAYANGQEYNPSVSYIAGFVWYPYTTDKGTTYVEYYYSRNYTGFGAFDSVEKISDNEYKIHLRKPWGDQDGHEAHGIQNLPAGTKIMNTTEGGTYNYCQIAKHNGNEWEHREYIIEGEDNEKKPGYHFRNGVKSVKGLVLLNYRPSGNTARLTIKNFKFTELE